MKNSVIGMRLGDLSNIPQHMLDQLKSSKKRDPLERQILEIISDLNNIAGIDEVFLDLYRRFNVEMAREDVAKKLAKMVGRGLINSTKGKCGIYRIEVQK